MSEDEVERLVALYVEGREAGEILSEEDFAAAYPSFRPELERLLRALRDTEAALSHTETPATIVGGYRIVRALGGGGSAMVFEAAGVADPNVSVAIKFLAPQAALDERARRRFQREIEALGRVRHPARLEQADHPLGARREVGQARQAADALRLGALGRRAVQE